MCSDQPDLPNDPRFANMVERVKNRSLTDKTVGDSFGRLARDELLKKLADADIAFAEVNTMADLATHPHLRRIEVDTPNGKISYAAPAAIFVGEPREIWRSARHRRSPRAAKGATRQEVVMSAPAIAGEKPDIDHLRQWIGRTEEASDVVTAQLVKGLRATLFQEIGQPKVGDAAPFTTHWCLLAAGLSDVATEPGRPSRPAAASCRRCRCRAGCGRAASWNSSSRCASATRSSAPRASRTSNLKTGSTGTLCFVAVQHEITTPRGIAIRERHDIVYREATTGPQVAPKAPPAPPSAKHRESHVSDPVLLFRYSALTFNGHRIHYDRDYVTKVEGYPGLVFHGPLQASFIVEFAAKLHGGKPPKKLVYRGVQPLFEGSEFSINANDNGSGGLEIWTANARRTADHEGCSDVVLRSQIVFDTRVTAAIFDEDSDTWSIETDRGDRVVAKFCIMAVGCLSAPNRPAFSGMDDFRGPIYHTGEWPHEGVDFSGMRVGVIGTGSSAVQSIPIIAQQASQLTVFQRTATWSVPAWNETLSAEYLKKAKANYPELRAKARARPTGFYFPFNTEPALQSDAGQRQRQYEAAWQRGGLPFLGAYGDLL